MAPLGNSIYGYPNSDPMSKYKNNPPFLVSDGNQANLGIVVSKFVSSRTYYSKIYGLTRTRRTHTNGDTDCALKGNKAKGTLAP